MSEVSSAIKDRVGWITYKEGIYGPEVSTRALSLRPYTTTGEAFKVVPDPENTPHEYFTLEFRKSTGSEVWRPDGDLPEEGLFITHMNERVGVASTWLLREAPFFDPEFADGSHDGATDWTGHRNLSGKVFPQGSRDSFTPATTPSSNFYGGRRSGLYITDIRVVDNEVHFNLRIEGLQSSVGWTVSDKDRAVAGRFTPESQQMGEEVFMRNDNAAALLIHRQAQWMAARKHTGWIGGWNLGGNDRELVGDFDGDGQDEIYIRSEQWAGILKWKRSGFESVTVQDKWIDDWNLGPNDREYVADVDGDGTAEIYIRSHNWAGVLKLVGGRLRLQSLQEGRIGEWNLSENDVEYPGRFRRGNADEIVVRSHNWLGLLAWDFDADKLKLVNIQHDRIDGWNLGDADAHFVGDFDGDGLDEIYIRSDNWAGVMKWRGGRFRVEWMTSDEIPHASGDPNRAQPLTAGDHSYSGRFQTDRDGILHRADNRLSVLVWNGSAMEVRQIEWDRLGGRWSMGNRDNYVLGDFHRKGTDVVDTHKHFVIDGLTDAFIHNGWGTAMVGVNDRPKKFKFGLTWVQEANILEAP